MSQVQRTANRCDQCGHEWLPSIGVVYTHCTSGKCRSRLWNKAKTIKIRRNPSAPPFKGGKRWEIVGNDSKLHNNQLDKAYAAGLKAGESK